MLYTPHNVMRKCLVVDIEGGPNTLQHVTSVDTGSAQVRMALQPVRIDSNGEVATYIEQFRSIHPIYGAEPLPTAFHCYR